MSKPKGPSGYCADEYVSNAFDRMAALPKSETTPEHRAIAALRQQLTESLAAADRYKERAKEQYEAERLHRNVASEIQSILQRYDHDLKISKQAAINEANDADRDAFKEVWDAAWEIMRTDFMSGGLRPTALFESVRDSKFQSYMDAQLKAASDTNT